MVLYAEGRRTDKNSVFISSDFCCLTDPVDPYTGEKNGKKHIFVRKTIDLNRYQIFIDNR